VLEFSAILNPLLFNEQEIIFLLKIFFKKMIASPAKIAVL